MSDCNLILDVDSYKTCHWKLMPPGTTSQFDYIESRGGDFDRTVFFGLQYYLKKYLSKPITADQVVEARDFYAAHGVPFNYEGWMSVVYRHNGKLPVRIRAVPEGTVVPTRNALVTVESTDPELFWLTGWLETSLLRSIWYPTNVATLSFHIKQLLLRALHETSEDPEGEIAFKLHDFGSRGVSSQESAAIGGAAHLVNFMGSDTVVGVRAAQQYYKHAMPAYSISATEHSTITAWGKEGECDAYANLLAQYAKPGSIIACVSDSYDIFNACEKLWGGELRQWVIDSGATLVVRPDSGHPATIVPEVLKSLDSKFGHTINSKGFKVLNHVKVIQGDGINYESIQEILKAVIASKYSVTNLALGMGGALLQQHNRDSQRFAMKCSSVTVNDEERDVYKDPVTDGGKKSKAGRLDLIRTTGWSDKSLDGFETVKLAPGQFRHPESIMQTVYVNGELFNETSLEEVRKKANEAIRI